MEIRMETIDDHVTKGTFGEDERRLAGFGIESKVSRKVRDGSVLVGMGSEGVGMFRSITATPLHPKTLRAHIFEISGQLPGKNWHQHFLNRHKELHLAKPNDLDPKRARNFNKTSVTDYFTKRQELHDRFGDIPPEHDWNMDEKGIQLGGRRKGNMSKFIFTRGRKYRYRIHSDNLELVTIIEAIVADGFVLPPVFVLKDGPVPDCRDIDGLGG